MLPTGAFASVQTFLRALATKKGSGIDTSGNLDTAANRKRALELLRGFAGRLDTEDVQLDLAAKLGDQGAQRLSQQVDALLDALGAAEAGIPSYRGSAGQQPGQQGSGSRRQPYRRDEGRDEGLGDLGTLEGGGRGRYGSRSRRERGGQPEPEMSVKDKVYNLPDNIPTNSAQQLLYWAYSYWNTNAKKMPPLSRGQRTDWYAVARHVVAYLRTEIAGLQNTPEVRRDMDLQIELRRRYELLDEAEQLLRGR
jgi:hypothetical protein